MRLFDVLGPVMTGPSSSHTAGAVRIGLTARNLLGEAPKTAEILLHGEMPGQITDAVAPHPFVGLERSIVKGAGMLPGGGLRIEVLRGVNGHVTRFHGPVELASHGARPDERLLEINLSQKLERRDLPIGRHSTQSPVPLAGATRR